MGGFFSSEAELVGGSQNNRVPNRRNIYNNKPRSVQNNINVQANARNNIQKPYNYDGEEDLEEESSIPPEPTNNPNNQMGGRRRSRSRKGSRKNRKATRKGRKGSRK